MKTDDSITAEKLIELGFYKVHRSKNYRLKHIIAMPHQEYFFFRYGRESLPISSNMTALKRLINGIYETDLK